jgi:hypothetical protein
MLQRIRRRSRNARQTTHHLELSMNRIFSAITLQSIAAAAVLVAAAPMALADNVSDPFAKQTFHSTADRAQVRSDAIAARDAQLRMPVGVETRLDPTAQRFVSTANRAQVHAEAVEAARLGLTGSYDGKTVVTPEQLAQIARAGERANGLTLARTAR